MKISTFITFILVLSVSFIFIAGEKPTMDEMKEKIQDWENTGNFTMIVEYLRKCLTERERTSEEIDFMRWEKERIKRVQRDYRFTREDIIGQLQRRVRDFELSELDEWTEKGNLTSRYIDGRQYYFYAAVSNMFFRHPEIFKRNIGFERHNPHPEIIDKIKETSRFEHDYNVNPVHNTLRFDLEITENLSEGDILEVWIPYPRSFPFQDNIITISASEDLQIISPAESPMRTAYFKRIYKKPGDEKFHIVFSYTSWGRYREICIDSALPIDSQSPEYGYYLQQRSPHVVFHPEITARVDGIIGNEINPYLKARKIYDWLLDNFQYSFAPEYSTQRNISYETFVNGYGDCGQLTLLFMTMLRYAGVPARWQSGWVVYPHRRGLHDWCEIYIPPYGWLAVDVTVMIGLQSRNEHERLEEEVLESIRDFYFGNMHPYVFVANADHGREFIPEKTDFRSDTVDSQRGEVQVNGRNIYYDGFSRSLSVPDDSATD